MVPPSLLANLANEKFILDLKFLVEIANSNGEGLTLHARDLFKGWLHYVNPLALFVNGFAVHIGFFY
jgi:hypothetical protein